MTAILIITLSVLLAVSLFYNWKLFQSIKRYEKAFSRLPRLLALGAIGVFMLGAFAYNLTTKTNEIPSHPN